MLVDSVKREVFGRATRPNSYFWIATVFGTLGTNYSNVASSVASSVGLASELEGGRRPSRR